MGVLESFVLGVVEGATEFLPISSTGHLILASSLFGIPATDFLKTFEIAIQLGAILAVIVLYFKAFFDLALLARLAAAFIPTALVGLLVFPVFKNLLEGNVLVVLISLFVGGIVLVAFEYWHGEREDVAPAIVPRELPYGHAVLVGFAQALAIIPGVSRSGATIIGGLALGINRATIVEFSFLLAVPTMLAATALALYKGHAFAYTGQEWLTLGVGFIAAFVVALLAIRWLLGYVRGHSFTVFGVYRIILSLVFFAYLFA
jgi:undecaprenyl-diphosphatase